MNTHASHLSDHPARLLAADGGEYTLIRQPRKEGDQFYPAIYAGPEGGEFTPDLSYVIHLAQNRRDERPMMIRFR
jgi:hypothetical protein